MKRLPILAAAAVLLACAGVALLASGGSAASESPPRVTMIGDSVPAALDYVTSARRYLTRGYDMRLDLRVCRRLVAASCTYQGSTPATAYQTISSLGRSIGQTAVIDVGYNDAASTYRSGLDTIMRALVKQHVQTVVWVTMREERSEYALINGAIRHATGRWPQLVVADWNAASRGHDSWFASDGLHLNSAGAWGLAHLIRHTLQSG